MGNCVSHENLECPRTAWERYWDKKAESLRVYVSKIQAYTKFIGMGDKLNPVLMMKCPTQLEYGAIDVMKSENLTLVDLYKAN
jgi:hypothetical protein